VLLVHSASAIGMWLVQKDFEIATLADFFVVVEYGLDIRCYRRLYWNLKVFLRYKLPDHSIIFTRWRQQHKNGRVMLGFATHF